MKNDILSSMEKSSCLSPSPDSSFAIYLSVDGSDTILTTETEQQTVDIMRNKVKASDLTNKNTLEADQFQLQPTSKSSSGTGKPRCEDETAPLSSLRHVKKNVIGLPPLSKKRKFPATCGQKSPSKTPTTDPLASANKKTKEQSTDRSERSFFDNFPNIDTFATREKDKSIKRSSPISSSGRPFLPRPPKKSRTDNSSSFRATNGGCIGSKSNFEGALKPTPQWLLETYQGRVKSSTPGLTSLPSPTVGDSKGGDHPLVLDSIHQMEVSPRSFTPLLRRTVVRQPREVHVPSWVAAAAKVKPATFLLLNTVSKIYPGGHLVRPTWQSSKTKASFMASSVEDRHNGGFREGRIPAAGQSTTSHALAGWAILSKLAALPSSTSRYKELQSCETMAELFELGHEMSNMHNASTGARASELGAAAKSSLLRQNFGMSEFAGRMSAAIAGMTHAAMAEETLRDRALRVFCSKMPNGQSRPKKGRHYDPFAAGRLLAMKLGQLMLSNGMKMGRSVHNNNKSKKSRVILPTGPAKQPGSRGSKRVDNTIIGATENQYPLKHNVPENSMKKTNAEAQQLPAVWPSSALPPYESSKDIKGLLVSMNGLAKTKEFSGSYKDMQAWNKLAASLGWTKPTQKNIQ